LLSIEEDKICLCAPAKLTPGLSLKNDLAYALNSNEERGAPGKYFLKISHIRVYRKSHTPLFRNSLSHCRSLYRKRGAGGEL